MAAVTNIIAALGIDSTLWMQLGTFAFVYLFLKQLVFNPYFRAFEERQDQTQGNQEKAEEIFAQTRELSAVYQRKARSLNADIKAVYDKAKLEATREQDKIVSEAREKAKKVIESAREKIQEQMNHAREGLIRETPELSRVISDNLLPKEVRQ